MITTAIIDLLFWVIRLIISPLFLLPDVTLPTGIASGISTASGYLHSLNDFIPVDTLLEILGVYIGFEVAYFTYKGIMWIIKKVPMIN